MVTIEGIIWYLFLIDCLGANLVAWFFPKWWKKKKWHKIIPMSRAWTFLYIVLILWIGSTLYRLGVLF
tara:strand:+ start:224 stop:427 length:204 start_codon:yes stop_codon:yes gene_type:complete